MHLDLVDPDPSAVDRLVALSASIVGEHQIAGGRHRWTVMQDPEGNEFASQQRASLVERRSITARPVTSASQPWRRVGDHGSSSV